MLPSYRITQPPFVPAKAGTQSHRLRPKGPWVPALAGTNGNDAVRQATMKCRLLCTHAFRLLLFTFLLTTLAARPASANDPVTFKGMTINIDVGFGPGGGYDVYARVLARHLGKYLPGTPTVIVRNMPGGGSLRVANYIYSAAPKDGSELGAIAASAAMDALMGNDQAKFEASKFGWVGSM